MNLKAKLQELIDTTTRDICSIAVTAAPKSRVRPLVQSAIDRAVELTLEACEETVENGIRERVGAQEGQWVRSAVLEDIKKLKESV